MSEQTYNRKQVDDILAPWLKLAKESEETIVKNENHITTLESENNRLKHSLGLCHYYAGCDDHVCELDGDMCSGQQVKPIEFLCSETHRKC